MCENENFEGFGSLKEDEWRGNVRKFVGKWEMGGGGSSKFVGKCEILKFWRDSDPWRGMNGGETPGNVSENGNEWRGNAQNEWRGITYHR